MKPCHSRRSVLAVPGSSEKMLRKSMTFDVDQIFLDLEDAVASDAKSQARELISTVKREDFRAPILSVRVNSLESPWFDEDIALLGAGVASWVDSIILPKVRNASDVERVSAVLEKTERDSNRKKPEISIDVQIESAQGLVNCEEIARSKRVTSLNFGPADFMADLGMTAEEVTSNEYALMRILVAARAAGVLAIDGPTLEVREHAKFERSAAIAAAMGFDGKWVLHPEQIDFCHEHFTPSQHRFDEASCLLEAYEFFTSAAGGGKGAAIYKGAMIDEASRKMALAIVARGSAAGLEPTKHFLP